MRIKSWLTAKPLKIVTRWIPQRATIAIIFLTSAAHLSAQPNTTEFDVNSLRKGDVIITPLIDLRDPKEKIDINKKIDFYTPSQRTHLSENLGKILFSGSKYYRYITSGSALDEFIKIKNLGDITRRANSAAPLSPSDLSKINSVLPGFQYVIFFSFTHEKLNRQFSRETPPDADGFLFENIYTTQRLMSAKLSILDLQNNQIVHVAEINPIAESKKSVFIKTGKKPSAYKFTPPNFDLAIEPDKFDLKPQPSLETELAVHKDRFPPLPERDPEFSEALKKFNKSPTQAPQDVQSRAKPKEKDAGFKDNFRMEFTVRSTLMGVLPLPSIFIGAGTLKWKILRLGGGLEFSPFGTLIDHEVRIYNVYNTCLSLSADVEWQFGSFNRILTGAYLGSGFFSYKQSDMLPDLDGTKSKKQTDGYIYRAPRVRYLIGGHQGLQFGVGIYQHIFDRLEKPELVANHPSQYGLEISLAAALGG